MTLIWPRNIVSKDKLTSILCFVMSFQHFSSCCCWKWGRPAHWNLPGPSEQTSPTDVALPSSLSYWVGAWKFGLTDSSWTGLRTWCRGFPLAVIVSSGFCWVLRAALKSISHFHCIIMRIWFRSYLNGLVVFPTLFNFSLNLAIRSSWSEPQSSPGLVFADCIELLHLWLQRI